MRTLIDLPEEDVKWLDRLAADQGKSRAAVMRDAVSAYRAAFSKDWIARGAGYWKHRTDIRGGVEYQREIREDRTSLD